ncbi:MAG: hypothetical protein ACK512_04940 [Cyanobium sp.]
MLPPDRRTAFARHTQWLALALEALVLSCFSPAPFPWPRRSRCGGCGSPMPP